MSKQKRHTHTWAQYRPSKVKSSTAHRLSRLGSMSAHLHTYSARQRGRERTRSTGRSGGLPTERGENFAPLTPLMRCYTAH